MVFGCAPRPLVRLREKPDDPLAHRLIATARGGWQPSDDTQLFLRKHALPEKIRGDVGPVLTAVRTLHRQSPDQESCFALAELNYVGGKRLERRARHRAMHHYLNCVARSYSYLFSQEFNAVRNPYDPRFRAICDLYNGSLENALRIAQSDGKFKPGEKLTLTTEDGSIEVSIDPKGRGWKAEDFERFEFVSNYELTGLRNQHRTRGLGVPLIAVRRNRRSREGEERYYAPGLSFPVTAFLRLTEFSNDDANGDRKGGSRQVRSQLELHDPLETSDIQIAAARVPLESDITTPMAYFLDNRAIKDLKLDTLGLLEPDEAAKHSGLYMVQPYQPGKIPVVMIHGLWSSPMTWMEALNDLRAVPEIRERYQFWFYLYPSGEPFPIAAADLRRHLDAVHRVFGDRQSSDTLENMVLVGHSMGGLIARMMTVDSGDRFWQSVAGRDAAAASEPDGEIRRVFFFESNPSISRVVTIASPHRGSEYANGFTAWLGRRLISLPRRTLEMAGSVVGGGGRRGRSKSLIPATSVESLDPDSPILQALLEAPKPKSVRYHNIVGVIGKQAERKSDTDGIVEYASAHLDEVDSEIVVRAPHSGVQSHPRTVVELERILRLHLIEVDRSKQTAIVPLAHEADEEAGWSTPTVR